MGKSSDHIGLWNDKVKIIKYPKKTSSQKGQRSWSHLL